MMTMVGSIPGESMTTTKNILIGKEKMIVRDIVAGKNNFNFFKPFGMDLCVFSFNLLRFLINF